MTQDWTNIFVSNLPAAQRKLGITAGGVPATRKINTTAPLTGGGDLSADRTLSIPVATAIANGYLSSADWSAFNAKESVLTFNTPLSRTANAVSIANAAADGVTKGAAAFTASDFDAASGVISIDYTNGQAASSVNKGFLTSTDWSTFNAKVSATRSIATTSPLTGGGDLSADRTFAIPAATGSVNGYLTSTDWTTFNAKESALTFTAPLVRTTNTVAPDFTATTWIWTAINIAATPTDRITLTNTQAAISGTQQYSPALRFTGQGFKSDVTTGSKAVDFRIYLQPVQSAGNPTGNLLFQSSVDGSTFGSRLTVDTNGNVTSGSVLTAGTNLISLGGATIAIANSYQWSGRSKLFCDADSQVRLSNQAGTDFGRLQFGGTTSSFPALARATTTLKVRLADDSADAGLLCGAFTASGNLSFFGATAAAQQASAANLTNNVTAGGTTDTIANYTDLTTYANDAAAIRNDIYQLARKLKQVNDALRVYGLLT